MDIDLLGLDTDTTYLYLLMIFTDIYWYFIIVRSQVKMLLQPTILDRLQVGGWHSLYKADVAT